MALVIPENILYNMFKSAFQNGVRLLDITMCYRNETNIGLALSKLFAEKIIKREDLCICLRVMPFVEAPLKESTQQIM